jgi:hypothetical protein
MEQDKLNKGGRKTNIANYEERIPEAMNMILYEKMSYTQFREEGARRWGITQRSAEDVWKKVKERIKDKFDEKSDEIIQDQLARYFDLLTRCRDNGNKRVEREVLQDLNKLYGLDVKKVDLTSNGQPISININLTD